MADPQDHVRDEKEATHEREQRKAITLRVDYKRVNSFFADYTKNISRGGTFIRTPRPLDVGTEFVFLLALPDNVQFELTGVVKWLVNDAHASPEAPAGMGIKFVFADDAQRHAVESVVESMMTDALGPVLAAKLLRGVKARETDED